MARVEWLGGVEWLGAPEPVPLVPPECSGVPGIAECVIGAMGKAQLEPECAEVAPEAKNACLEYYHRLHIYKDCKGLCPSLGMPLKLAPWPKPLPPLRKQQGSSEKASGAGWVVAGLVVAGAVLAVVALRS